MSVIAVTLFGLLAGGTSQAWRSEAVQPYLLSGSRAYLAARAVLIAGHLAAVNSVWLVRPPTAAQG